MTEEEKQVAWEAWEEKREEKTNKLLHNVLDKVERGRWRQSWGEFDARRGATVKLTRDECNVLTGLLCSELNWLTARDVEKMEKVFAKVKP
jgi:hypothetical protein